MYHHEIPNKWPSQSKIEKLRYRSSLSVNDLKGRMDEFLRAKKSLFECVIVSWQDMKRKPGSGDHIVDAYIVEKDDARKVLMFRRNNFQDDQHRILSSKCIIQFGDDKMTLARFLDNFGTVVNEKFGWKKCEGVSLAKHQSLNTFSQDQLRVTIDPSDNKLTVLPFDRSFQDILQQPSVLLQHINQVFTLKQGHEVMDLKDIAFIASVNVIVPMLMDFADQSEEGVTELDAFLTKVLFIQYPHYKTYDINVLLATLSNVMTVLSDAKETFSGILKSLTLEPKTMSSPKDFDSSVQTDSDEHQGQPISKKPRVEHERERIIPRPTGENFEVDGCVYENRLSGLAEEVTVRYMTAWLVLGDTRNEVEFTCALYTYSAPVLALLQYTSNGTVKTSMKYLPANAQTRLTIVEKDAETNAFVEHAIKGEANESARHDGSADRQSEDTKRAEEESCVIVYQIPLLPNERQPYTGFSVYQEPDFGDDDVDVPMYRSLAADTFAYAAEISVGTVLSDSEIDYDAIESITRAQNANVTMTKCYYSVSKGVPNEQSLQDRVDFLEHMYGKQEEQSIHTLQNDLGNLMLRS